MRLYRFIKRKKDRMEQKGCWVSGFKTPFDLSVNADNMCDIKGHLLTDTTAAALFFIGGDYSAETVPEQCAGIIQKIMSRFYNLLDYFAFENFENPKCSSKTVPSN